MNRLEKLPVPILPTFVGACTLSNVYAGLGYTWVRHITMWAAAIILLCYLVKIIRFPKTIAAEYSNTVPASLYAAFTMIMMILGSYIFEYNALAGKFILIAAVCIHALHILVFSFRNVIKKRDMNTFVPTWFVTYNGILVSCVVGSAMGINHILKYIVYYGVIIYFIIIPIMIWRLIKVEVKPPVYHTMAVVLAPCSLCVVAVINILENPPAVLIYILYICVFLSVLFVISRLPKFFSVPFTPGFAAMTFPMAIGIVASNKMAGYLANAGNTALSNIITQIAGIQIYITTMIIAFVLLNFFIQLTKKATA